MKTTAKTMAAVDEDNEVDGYGATGNGATGDYGDDDDYGDGQWTATTMVTARQATKSTMMVKAQRAMMMTKTTTTTTTTSNEVDVDDDDDNDDGQRSRR